MSRAVARALSKIYGLRLFISNEAFNSINLHPSALVRYEMANLGASLLSTLLSMMTRTRQSRPNRALMLTSIFHIGTGHSQRPLFFSPGIEPQVA